MHKITSRKRLILLCPLIVGVLLVGLSEARAQSGTTRFAVIGDYGSGRPQEQDVANLVKSWNPDFIITTGDNNYPNGEASTIDPNIGQFYHDFIYPYLTIGASLETKRGDGKADFAMPLHEDVVQRQDVSKARCEM